MAQPLAYLLKQIHVRAGSKYMLYHLWGSIDPSVLDREKSNRAPTATAYTKMGPDKLARKLFGDTDATDERTIADAFAHVFADCDPNRAPVRDEMPNALGRIVADVFDECFEKVFYDNEASYRTAEVAYAIRDASSLSFLWEMPFKRNFSACLATAFPHVTDNLLELFWDEYDQLLLVPFRPTPDRLDELDIAEQKRELKRNLEQHLTLLATAALLGPGAYFEAIGLMPPARNATPPYGFKPAQVVSANSARLQPIIMLGEGVADYYTDEKSDVIGLDASSGAIVFGRNPIAEPGQRAIKVRSSLQNVSRQHAQVSYDAGSGWLIKDTGADQEGSSWGTLVLYASGGSEHLFGEEALLHHGDVICLAPDLRERLGSPIVTPPIGVEDLCFRFETTTLPSRTR